MFVFGPRKKATRSGNQFRCALICHYHACLHTHTHMQAAHTHWLLADMIGRNWPCGERKIAEIASDRPNRGSILSSRLTRTKSFFSPDIIVVAFSHFLCPVLPDPFSSPSHCLHTSLFDPILFPLNLFIISFFSPPPSLNPTHPFRSDPSQGDLFIYFSLRGSDVPAASPLCSRYCLGCNTTGMFHTENSQKPKVPK